MGWAKTTEDRPPAEKGRNDVETHFFRDISISEFFVV